MPSMDDVYKYFEENKLVKFTLIDLTEIFQCPKKTIEGIVFKMWRKRVFYDRLDRSRKFIIVPFNNSTREVMCYQYFFNQKDLYIINIIIMIKQIFGMQYENRI